MTEKNTKSYEFLFSVAPMMDWNDRHCRAPTALARCCIPEQTLHFKWSPSANVGIGGCASNSNLPSTVFRDFKRTIRGNIADLRRVGESGSGLSLPKFYDFARLPSISCDPLRSMVAPRQLTDTGGAVWESGERRGLP